MVFKDSSEGSTLLLRPHVDDFRDKFFEPQYERSGLPLRILRATLGTSQPKARQHGGGFIPADPRTSKEFSPGEKAERSLEISRKGHPRMYRNELLPGNTVSRIKKKSKQNLIGGLVGEHVLQPESQPPLCTAD